MLRSRPRFQPSSARVRRLNRRDKRSESLLRNQLEKHRARFQFRIRRIWHSRLVTVTLMVIALVSIRSIQERSNVAADRWGVTRQVFVAGQNIRAGEAVTAKNVQLRAVPLALLPAGVVSSSALVIGRSLRRDIAPGEMITASALGRVHQRGVITMTGPDRVGVALPSPPARPPIEVGDLVDVVSLTVGASEENQTVSSVEVVTQTEQAITVAASAQQAQQLVQLLAAGPITILLRGQ
jgi:Flp pilus assembly protein CpaB